MDQYLVCLLCSGCFCLCMRVCVMRRDATFCVFMSIFCVCGVGFPWLALLSLGDALNSSSFNPQVSNRLSGTLTKPGGTARSGVGFEVVLLSLATGDLVTVSFLCLRAACLPCYHVNVSFLRCARRVLAVPSLTCVGHTFRLRTALVFVRV